MYTNKGIVNGRSFFRGQAILVHFATGTFTAIVDRINSSAGNLPDDELTVDALIITGRFRGMDAGAVDPKFAETPNAYANGFYHQSTKIRRGENSDILPARLFCFPDEEPIWVNNPVPISSITESVSENITTGNS